MPALKILKDGNHITYIYTTEKENIPLVSVENGEIKILINRISSEELAYRLAASIIFAVLINQQVSAHAQEEGGSTA